MSKIVSSTSPQQGDREERQIKRNVPVGALPVNIADSLDAALLMYFKIHGHECNSVSKTDYWMYEKDFIPNYGNM